ncbi:polysaccharide pyruvyl transferase family protein [Promicromonospora citrea]|uniref:GumL protein n=1 Tax=Promicromonospora citrea TaxID=43677 RepID=A0A8H9GFP9_9MICO|nr:polysaccharide pyruvyl transferase family protein [Promicromonospora citrea]NNH53570.1 polysaccharide pyruvyl transferase family protein [Promicromonospora citrea]GGM18699.1 GumL protein [Promicromonospora citrea]
MTVEVVHWNPLRPVVPGRLGRLVPVRRRVNNVGDLLGPALVARLLAEHGVDPARGAARRLLTVGSILHLAGPGDVVWGSGVNGKEADLPPGLDLDVRAVRGPLTHRLLREAGVAVPAVFGDPALLWGRFWPREAYADGPWRSVGFVPNLHDVHRHRADPRVIAPQGELHAVVGQIARCDLVVATSLHGIVLAESFGIPARLVPPSAEPMHKYHDYYAGTGRAEVRVAASVDEAVELGGAPPPAWDADALLAAFPLDLWA